MQPTLTCCVQVGVTYVHSPMTGCCSVQKLLLAVSSWAWAGCISQSYVLAMYYWRDTARDTMQIVAGWNGMAIQAFASASVVLQQEDPPQAPAFPVEGCPPSTYLQAALQVMSRYQYLHAAFTGPLSRQGWCSQAPASFAAVTILNRSVLVVDG